MSNPSNSRLAAIMVSDMFGYSRLMELNEADTINRQKSHRKDLIDPEINRQHGRIVKSTGDGLLVEFSTTIDAVQCAIRIQTAMSRRESGIDPDLRILYRIGINVGDIVYDDGDIFGDCVNVAARIEGLAEPGGVCISDVTHQLVSNHLDARFIDMGSQRVKNISRTIRVWQWTAATNNAQPEVPTIANSQRVGFCSSSEGVQIAWSSLGRGTPVLKAPNWFNHIEYEWRVPAWKGMLEQLTRRFQLVRFDQRGNGLSDWEVDEISNDAMIADMEAVADAAGLEKFGLFALSQGCAFSIRFAAEFPEKVNFLILCGGYARGAMHRGSPDQASMTLAMETMIRQGWGSPLPTFRQIFTSMFMTGASPENAVRIFHMNNSIDYSDIARQVKVPTLVLHCRDDGRIPFDEGRRLASLIPDAQFVALEGASHMILPGSPAFTDLFEQIDNFVSKIST